MRRRRPCCCNWWDCRQSILNEFLHK
jgi:hypothetical protein